jgi:hypothetical protein
MRTLHWNHTSPDGFDREVNDLIDLTQTRLYNSAIIAYTNEDVNNFNSIASEFVRSTLHVDEDNRWRLVAHEFPGDGEGNFATPDIMETYDEPGVPPHVLDLFPGALTTLMRNFLPSRGLINGALLLVLRKTSHTVTVLNITRGSPFWGQEETLFRFTFTLTVKGLFSFERKQYPLRLAYAGTVHRFQGDTVEGKLLVDCRVPSFAHGQLSVAISRGTCCANIVIIASEESCHNRLVSGLIYREFLSWDVSLREFESSIDVNDIDIRRVFGGRRR